MLLSTSLNETSFLRLLNSLYLLFALIFKLAVINILISAILAYAAHIEDKDASVLDMTGLAQKGGAVWSHIGRTTARTGRSL